DVAIPGADVVALGVPVPGELEDRLLVLRAEPHEGEREAAARVVLAPQEPHPEHLAVEAQGLVQVVHAQHGVEQAHGGAFTPGRGRALAPINVYMLAMPSRRKAHAVLGLPGDAPFAVALRRTLSGGYELNALRADLFAGTVVGIVALPLSMALAIAVGVPPQHGLYTAIV